MYMIFNLIFQVSILGCYVDEDSEQAVELMRLRDVSRTERPGKY